MPDQTKEQGLARARAEGDHAVGAVGGACEDHTPVSADLNKADTNSNETPESLIAVSRPDDLNALHIAAENCLYRAGDYDDERRVYWKAIAERLTTFADRLREVEAQYDYIERINANVLQRADALEDENANLRTELSRIKGERDTAYVHVRAVETDREVLTHKGMKLCNDYAQLNLKKLELESQLTAATVRAEQAAQDTKRLDFLSDPNHRPDYHGHRWIVFGTANDTRGDTLRDAIDAAMATQESQ